MSNWTGSPGRKALTIGLISAATDMVSVTSGASAVPGNWVTLGQFGFPVNGFILYTMVPNTGRPGGCIIDVALGSGDTTIVERFMAQEDIGRAGSSRNYYFPLRIPAATNVLMRLTAHTTISVQMAGAMTGFAAGPAAERGFAKVENINVSTSGAAVTISVASSLANTKGTAVSMTTGGLPRGYKGLYIGINKNVATSSGNNRKFFIDILSGSEKIINDIPMMMNSGTDQNPTLYGPYMINLQAGMPIQVVTQVSDISGLGDQLEVALYGMY